MRCCSRSPEAQREPARPVRDMSTAPSAKDGRVKLRARRRIWAGGALAILVLGGFGALGVQPLVGARRDDARVRSSAAVLQQLAEMRAALSAWQVYVQP